MARGTNFITLIGALTARPELRYTSSGLAILELKLAGNHHTYDGGERTAVFYHSVTVFGKPAEWFTEAEHDTGAIVAVTGRLNYRSWEAEDGQRRSTVSINADSVTALAGAHHNLVKDRKGNERLERGLNLTVVAGNLTRDAEVRHTDSGNKIVHGAIAVNESFERNGKWEERTHFLDFTAWNSSGAPLEGAAKGAPVTLVGHFVIEGWKDRDGNWRNTPKIIVERAEVGVRNGQSSGAAAGRRPAARQEVVDEFPVEEELPF